MEILSEDVYHYLISFVDIRSIYIFSSISKSIYEYFLNEKYWENKYKRDFSDIIYNNSWKQSYRNKYTQIFTNYEFEKYISYHNFKEIECKDNMIMAVDDNDNLYTWLHSKYENGNHIGKYLQEPELLFDVKVKKVFNFRNSISYIDINDILWYARSNSKYPELNKYIFHKVSDIKVREFAIDRNHYFVIDLNNNIWRGEHDDLFTNNISDNNYVSSLKDIKHKTKKMVVYENHTCIIDLQNYLSILEKCIGGKELIYKHNIEILDVALTYSHTVFLDNNNDAWIHNHKNKIRKMAFKAKSISLESIIDLNDNVLLFDIEKCEDPSSFRKIPYIKGIKIRSFWGNSVIIGAMTVHK